MVVMMDFIMAPLIVGIICAGIYGGKRTIIGNIAAHGSHNIRIAQI